MVTSVMATTGTKNTLSEIDRLKKINAALMSQVERSMDQQGNAYTLFQTAINLEGQVRRRTEELTATLTSLEQSNRELKIAKESAELANLSKTRFLAAASHDLLQPLNASHLLMSSLIDLQENADGLELANQVERALQTIDELLRSLLEISRLDAGVVQPKIEKISLAELFDDLELSFMPIAKQQGVNLEFRRTDKWVLSDRGMLRRILQNIISNAIRYTDKGRVLVGVRNRCGTVRVDVLDTGIGIADEQKHEIFEEFHRGMPPSGVDSDPAGGLGLGLAIVARMLRTLDHDLSFESKLGKGSWFKVVLKQSQAPQISPSYSDRSAYVSRIQGVLGAKILLIENDQAVLKAMETLLGNWHCEVRSAKNMREALERVEGITCAGITQGQRWEPDVIVADQHLDNNDLGTETIIRVRQLLGVLTPSVIITANASEDIGDVVESSDIELMKKPVKPAALRALLAHLLS